MSARRHPEGAFRERGLGWTIPRDEATIAAMRAQGIWRNRTLYDDAVDLMATDPARVIAIAGDRRVTVAEAVGAGKAIAAALSMRGLRRGDVVTYVLPNWVEAISINMAAAFLGLTVNPIVPIYREAELRQILADCGSRAIFVPGRFRSIDFTQVLAAIRADLPALELVVGVRSDGDVSLDALEQEGRHLPFQPTPAAPDAIKLVMYTSGTTGPAKGVLHTHETLGRVMQVSIGNWHLPPGPRILIATPVSHVTGFMWGLESPFVAGTQVVLMERWNPDEAVELIDRHAIDLTTGAAPFLQDTVDAARRAGSGLPSLRRFGCGGAAVSPDLIRRAFDTFDHATAYRIYGSTEAPNVGQGHALAEDRERAATTDGHPLDYDVRIVGEEGGDLPAGQDGEIVARGPSLFVGYTDAALNVAAFDDRGYFRTGDIGHLTERGDIVITDRKKDLIIRGGENLSPKEVEDALASHPLVREVAVVGRPHDRLGETVCAFIVPQGGRAITLADITAWMATAGLARQKHPEHLECVDALPKTPAGKVRKDILRKQLADRSRKEISDE
ncbi:AMP-binding protein [Mesorhizobium sp. CAU 1741]|uniref:AMP-binding protein n=1 Tax=Mesorhizobium sp. CAU 1741 TaxID=3140366 RepID=UPI00325C2AE3